MLGLPKCIICNDTGIDQLSIKGPEPKTCSCEAGAVKRKEIQLDNVLKGIKPEDIKFSHRYGFTIRNPEAVINTDGC